MKLRHPPGQNFRRAYTSTNAILAVSSACIYVLDKHPCGWRHIGCNKIPAQNKLNAQNLEGKGAF